VAHTLGDSGPVQDRRTELLDDLRATRLGYCRPNLKWSVGSDQSSAPRADRTPNHSRAQVTAVPGLAATPDLHGVCRLQRDVWDGSTLPAGGTGVDMVQFQDTDIPWSKIEPFQPVC
jgi:hypothetical protein